MTQRIQHRAWPSVPPRGPFHARALSDVRNATVDVQRAQLEIQGLRQELHLSMDQRPKEAKKRKPPVCGTGGFMRMRKQFFVNIETVFSFSSILCSFLKAIFSEINRFAEVCDEAATL